MSPLSPVSPVLIITGHQWVLLADQLLQTQVDDLQPPSSLRIRSTRNGASVLGPNRLHAGGSFIRRPAEVLGGACFFFRIVGEQEVSSQMKKSGQQEHTHVLNIAQSAGRDSTFGSMQC